MTAPKGCRLNPLAGALRRLFSRLSPAASAAPPAARQPRRRVSFEVLEQRLLMSVDLLPVLGDVALPDSAPASQAITVPLTVHNQGDTAAGPVIVGLDARSVLNPGGPAVRLGQVDVGAVAAGGSSAPLEIVAPLAALAPGAYTLTAVVDPDAAVTDQNRTNNSVAVPANLIVEGRLGDLPGGGRIGTLQITEPDATQLTFTLTGSGYVRVLPQADGWRLDVSQSNATTVLSIAVSNGAATLHQLNVASSIGSVLAPGMTFSGQAAISGTIARLTLGDVTGPSTIAVGGTGTALAFTAGNVSDLTLTSAGGLGPVTVKQWLDTAAGGKDYIRAPSLATLAVQGDFGASLDLNGAGVSGLVLSTANIQGAIVGGSWNVQGRGGAILAGRIDSPWTASFAGALTQLSVKGNASGTLTTPSLQTLIVGGNLVGAKVSVGAKLGADGQFGGSGADADTFAAGVLSRLRVTGNVDGSVIRVGVDPVDGVFDDGDDVIAGESASRIQELLIGGNLVNGSRIAAGAFPASVRVGAFTGDPSGVPGLGGVVRDTTPPAFAAFSLAAADATNQALDQTGAATVQLKGIAEAGATVTLAGQNISVVAGAGGAFTMPGVALVVGANALTLTATDAAGNATSLTRTITRTSAVQADAVLTWNLIALKAVQLDVTDPPVATRTLAMVSLAQYDALAAIEGTPAYLVQRTVTGPTSAQAAAAVAAYRVLSLTYPAQKAGLDAQLAQSLAGIADGAAKDRGIALGLSVADAIIALRANDGADAFVEHLGSTAVGQWRPTGPAFDVPDEPQWQYVQPFALSSPSQFRPAAPPALDSIAYATAVEEIKRLGSATSSERTADQTQQALFWADGKGSYTPPGHWNLIAEDIARQQGNSLSANARLFAQLNVALADAAIACWDAKYTYDLWRPETAIQNAELDGNAGTTADAAWRPLLLTPAHPEYVSGHSTFSAAAATVLAATFGDDVTFTTTSPTLPGETRTYTSFSSAAQEAGRSRIFGGIHYEFTNQAGQVLGQQVAEAVLAKFELAADTQAPAVVADATPGAARANFTVTGQILDNLSGVASATVRLDGGPAQPLVLDALGRFSFATALATDGSADGVHTFTIVATDQAGNVSAGYARSFALDTKAPTLALDGLADGTSLTASARLKGSADATGTGLTLLNYKFDNGPARSLVFDATTGAFDQALQYGNLEVGSHTLTISVADAAGNTSSFTRSLVVDQLAPFVVAGVTPVDGSQQVGVTQRPQVVFSRAVNAATLNAASLYATAPDGSRLAATIVPSADGTYAWMFFADPMPGGAQITLHIDGSKIRAAADGAFLDADGNGTAGGEQTVSFTTVSTASVAGTRLIGRVVDPGPDLEPMTFDDIRRGPDGIIHTPDDVFLLPIAHAKVFILGREDQFVFTDENGFFELADVPAGTVKIAIDGRTATNAPAGVFFPEMVMDAELTGGVTNTLMGSMGSSQERVANADRTEVYLPRIATSILQSVSDTQPTVITAIDPAAAPALSEEEREALTLTIAPGSAVDENGNALDNVQIGIATVPPELVRDMLPPGVLQHTFDITIQAPGVATFTEPVQITFPNVFNAAPGTKLNILSFDHTTGRLVINGTGTVSADGKTVVSDPDSGVKAP